MRLGQFSLVSFAGIVLALTDVFFGGSIVHGGMELLACVYLAAGVAPQRLVMARAWRGISGNQLARNATRNRRSQ